MSDNCQKLKETLINTLTQLESEEERDVNNDIRIVILQRGWIMVGRYKRVDQYVTLNNAFVIRNWGTTKGIGELAKCGPLKDKTVLDAVNNEVEFHTLVEVANVKCSVKNWKEVCK